MADKEKDLTVQQAIDKTAVGYFMEQVSKFIRTMPEIISDSEGRRLTAALVIKANAALEENHISWKDINQPKFVNDTIRLVTMGLDAGNNEAYPIPYKNNKTGKIDMQCTPSAKGIKKLAELYSVRSIKPILEYVIKDGDKFTLTHTPNGDKWEYDEDVFGTGKTKGYVTIVIYADDNSAFVMTHSKEDIEKRRAASRSPDSPAWKNWYDEMALAKAIRRHCNRLSIRLPAHIKKAFDELEEEDAEQETKDVTPPTIPLPQGPISPPEQPIQPETKPATPPAEPPSQPAPPPSAPEQPAPPPAPAPATKTEVKGKPAQQPLPVQIPLESPPPCPLAEPQYPPILGDPNDTSWMN